ncbi:MAG: sulfatase, partial [Vicinamibacterales bacterium]
MSIRRREGKNTRGNRSSATIALAIFLAAVTLAALFGIRRSTPWPPSGRKPNILLVTLDTTRADHVGAYGYRPAHTPRLDRLAAEGVLFERVVSAAPITLPAHASIFTALYPFAHGVRNNGTFYLDAKFATLATVLHDAGYRTAAFISAFVLDRRYGLARGFDTYNDHLESGEGHIVNGARERRGDRTALAAEAWIAQAASGSVSAPFFVWLHLYDAHDPYDPPPPFHDAFADRPYDGEIAFDDDVVGSVLDRLDQLGLRSTLVAVVGDHGESLGEHGEMTH